MKKLILIDDKVSQVEKLQSALAVYHYFPETEPDMKLFYINYINPLVQNHDNPDASTKLFDYLRDNNIEPTCFIVDVSLNEQVANDLSGKVLRRNVLAKLYPDVPAIYVTQYTEKEIGELSDDEEFVLKKDTGSVKVDMHLKDHLPKALFKLLGDGVNNILKSADLKAIPTPVPSQNPAPALAVPDKSPDIITPSDFYELNKKGLEASNKQLKMTLTLSKIIKENDKLRAKINRVDTKAYWLHFIITVIYRALIFLSLSFLVYYSLGWFIYDYLKNRSEFHLSPFKIIEHIFIAPLPLIVLFTFYNYYKNVFVPILIEKKENTDAKKVSAMLDISITKYLFASVLFSTIVVSFLEIFSKILERTTKSGKSDDGNTYINIISQPELVAIGIGAGILILLFFYILKIEKHVSGKEK